MCAIRSPLLYLQIQNKYIENGTNTRSPNNFGPLAIFRFICCNLKLLSGTFFFGRRRSIYHQRFELRLCFLFEYGGMKQESRFGVVINCVFISGLKIICGILFYGDLWKFITLMHSYILCC